MLRVFALILLDISPGVGLLCRLKCFLHSGLQVKGRAVEASLSVPCYLSSLHQPAGQDGVDDMGVFTNKEPQHRPQYTIILALGAPEKGSCFSETTKWTQVS